MNVANAASLRAPVSGRRLLALGLAVAMLAGCQSQAPLDAQVQSSSTIQPTSPPFPLPSLPFPMPKGSGCGRDCFKESTIGIVDAASGALRSLALPPNTYDGPVVSPDGLRVALVAGSTQIVVVNIESLVMTTVSSIEDAGDVSPPSWSPDGTLLTYTRTSADGLGARIEVVSIEGGSPAQLVAGLAPSWSPDGRWIAYWKRGYEVWLVRPDGSDAHFLAKGFSPAWAGDSGSVVVSVPHHKISTIDQFDIADGHLIKELSVGQQGALSADGSLLGVLREVRPLHLRLWVGPAVGARPYGDAFKEGGHRVRLVPRQHSARGGDAHAEQSFGQPELNGAGYAVSSRSSDAYVSR
jgi:hypothetical protein